MTMMVPLSGQQRGLVRVAVSALAMLCGLAMLVGWSLQGEARRLGAMSRTLTVSVVDGDAGRQSARAAEVAAMLRARSDIAAVRPVPETELRDELGAGGLPAMVDATLVSGHDARGIERALAGVEGLRVTQGGRSLVPLQARLEWLATLSFVVAAGALLGGAIVAVVATRAAFNGEAAILVRLGAGTGQIAAPIGRGLVIDMAAGGAAGAMLAMSFMAVQGAVGETGAMRIGVGLGSGIGIGMALLPLAFGGLAFVASRLTVHACLRGPAR